MHWIWTVLIGFLAGLVARAVTPGKGPTGFIMTAVLGVAGSVLASFVGQAMGWYAQGEITGFIGSVVGAIVLLVVYHMATRGSGS
ncbi:MAG TPA: GlsB/YeaQ/YmgE family stress response membrane protein [Rhodocyclaceae bacterium]|nr:GlsB/YeaQ/YmgE family stress response membrane protein [Rhodocyclaceae bacterium]